MVSYNTSMRWFNEISQKQWKRCVKMFRMKATTLQSLCYDLKIQHGLKALRRMCVIKKTITFLYTLALGASNMEVQERFRNSGETINIYFNEVMRIICSLAVNIIKSEDPENKKIHHGKLQ